MRTETREHESAVCGRGDASESGRETSEGHLHRSASRRTKERARTRQLEQRFFDLCGLSRLACPPLSSQDDRISCGTAATRAARAGTSWRQWESNRKRVCWSRSARRDGRRKCQRRLVLASSLRLFLVHRSHNTLSTLPRSHGDHALRDLRAPDRPPRPPAHLAPTLPFEPVPPQHAQRRQRRVQRAHERLQLAEARGQGPLDVARAH